MHSNTRQAVRVDAFGLREMVLGKSRQAHQRTIMHSNTRQAKSRQAHQRTTMHSNTRQALNASTRSVYAKWYWVNHGRLTSERTASLREMVLGKSRQAHQRTIMHSNTRQAANNHALEHSTGSERVDAFGLREMVLGKSRQAHQRTAGSPANAKLTFRYPSSLINHSTLLLERSSAKLLVFYSSTRSRRAVESRQAHQRTAGSPANAKLTFRYPSSLINHSTLLLERSSAKLLVFYSSTRSRRAVEVIICMITRDFSVISIDVTGVSLSLSLSLSTTHKSHSRTI